MSDAAVDVSSRISEGSVAFVGAGLSNGVGKDSKAPVSYTVDLE